MSKTREWSVNIILYLGMEVNNKQHNCKKLKKRVESKSNQTIVCVAAVVFVYIFFFVFVLFS